MKDTHSTAPPILKTNFYTFRWSLLFVFDQLFGFSLRRKTEASQVMKKRENPSFIGRRFQKIHEKNVKKLYKVNKDFNPDGTVPLPEMDLKDFNPENFRHWKHKVNMPVVIRGFLNKAPIMELTNDENLISNFGQAQVQCADFKLDKKTSGAGQNVKLVKTSLEDYLSSDKYAHHYVNNFHGLLNNLDFYRLCDGKTLRKVQDNTCILNQWFIKRGIYSRSPLHCANGENIFLNVQGKKEWHFIDPSYSALMQATLSKYGVYSVSELIEYDDKDDFYETMTKHHEYFHKIPVYKVVLEPGDILYNPPWWWHDVRNVTDFTMGCASRWVDNKMSFKRIAGNSPTLFMGQMMELIKNPKKSPYYKVRKESQAEKFIDSIFSNKWSEQSEDKVPA